MNEITEEVPLESALKQYYENPLTVATNAMLHINGGVDQAPISLIYQDNFKEDQIILPQGAMGGALEVKFTNGTIETLPGVGHVDSVFLQGGAEVVKREPEDLTRKCISPERIVHSDKRRSVLLQGTPQSDSPPALIPTENFKDDVDPVLKDEDRHRINHTIIIQAPLDSGDKMSATGYLGSFTSPSPQSSYETVPYLAPSPQPYATSTSPVIRASSVTYSAAEPYYREYYQVTSDPQYSSIRPEYSTSEVSFDRYTRPAPSYKQILTVDSSPDSGISSDNVPTREQVLSIPQQQAFASYEDISQPTIISSEIRPVAVQGTSPGAQRLSPAGTPATTARSWHDFSRHGEGDKIQIPKIQSDDDKIHIEKIDNPYGFKFYLETPISTSPRREDDRITYINKGQFYAITMEYIPDPERHLKPGTVKSIIMLLFREEKSAEDEAKAWHFWHGRQHSVKQRILDVDTKNSSGLVGCIEEISHNAICVYWNPLEAPAKINIAVQCLSTDFSSQKGVKGLPLHIQIDTYEDPRDTGVPVFHRAYCQIKVFCDKGAERKTRDEERRAQKRRINPSTRKKYEDLYHAPCERSEFYTMADLMKEPVFFKPNETVDKVTYMNMDMPNAFYSHDPENGEIPKELTAAIPNGSVNSSMEEIFLHAHKRTRMMPPVNERMVIYVRRDVDDSYTPLHLVPPTTLGLLNAIEQKFQIPRTSIKTLFRKNNKAGIKAKLDDDLLKHYCNEDWFIIDIQRTDQDSFDITLIQLPE